MNSGPESEKRSPQPTEEVKQPPSDSEPDASLDEEDGLNSSQAGPRGKKNLRIAASSRVNFSKLSAREKEQRCQNLSKQLRNLKKKNHRLQEKLRRVSAHLQPPEHELHARQHAQGLADVQRAETIISENREFELPDQNQFIYNLCTQIVDGRLPLDSLPFQIMTTMVRNGLTPREKRGDELDFSARPEVPRVNFRERSVQISKKEFETYFTCGMNEELVRILTGSFENRSVPGGPDLPAAPVLAP